MKLHTISLLLLGLLLSSLSIHTAAAQNNTLNFNGTNNFVTFPYSPALDIADGTIEFWMRPDWVPGSVGQNPCVLGYRLSFSGTRFSVHVQADLSGIGIWNGISYEVRPFTFTQGTWYHIAAVESGTSTTFYVNGVSIGATANGFNTSVVNAPLTVGWSNVPSQTQEYFTGAMDEVRIWNRVLSQAEIAANFNRILTGQECNLLAYWNFDEASGTAITDATIAANNGTLAGGFARVPSGADIRGFAAPPTACTTTWNGTAWTNGRPTANTAATIAGNYSTQLHGNLLANELTVNASATLTIHASGRITATGAITNNGAINNCALGTLTFGSFAGNPVPPAALQPAVPASDMVFTATTTTSLSLSWTNGNGQRRIVVLRPNAAVANNAAFDNVVYNGNANFTLADTINNGTGNSVVVTNLTPNVRYHVAVFEYNETPCGINYSEAGAVAQRMTLPLAPVALPAQPITAQGFTARWVSAGTVNYLLEVSVREDFSTLAFSGFEFALNNIAQNNFSRVFFYRLRAVNTSGASAYSNVVRVALEPVTPVALPATDIKSNNFQARWNFAPGTERYELEVAKDSAFTQIVRRLTTESIQIFVTGLDENTTYFYRVRGALGNFFSGYSNIISLRTLFRAPVALEAGAVTPGGFTAKWETYPIADAVLEVEAARDDKFADILRRERISN